MSSPAGELRRAFELLRPELIDALSATVRIPSVVPTFPGEDAEAHLGTEGEVSCLIAGLLADCGCEIDLFGLKRGRENCVATMRGTGGGRSLILNGHVDVVPPQPAQLWSGGNPWSGKVADGQVWGRGSCDMKGGLIAATFAIRAIAEAGIKLRGDLLLHAVVGEEMMDHELGTTACIERGHRADAAVVAEPSPHGSRLAVCPATLGVMWFTLSLRGKGAHAGMRAESLRDGGRGVAVSAADLAHEVQGALYELERGWVESKQHPLFKPGSFTIHPGVVIAQPDSGPMPFGIPEGATLEYIVWYSPGEDPESVRTAIASCVEGVVAGNDWLRKHPPQIEWRHHWPAAALATEHPLVQATIEAHRSAHGEDPPVEGFSAVADVTYYEQAGIPALTYGPGDMALAHAVDERVPIDDVIDAGLTFAQLAVDWCET